MAGGKATTTPLRSAWLDTAEVAGPMSRFARYKKLRSSWRPNLPAVGCLVIAEDGTFGFGISRYGNPVIALINEHIAPLLAGESCTATERLWDMMVRIVSPYGPGGLASYAISAVDLALWDLKGKLLKAPVYELLGGPARERQVCYATGNDTDWHLELGFTATKLACPYGTADGLAAINGNEELVARTRSLIGRNVELMLDCWMAFDVEFTVRLAERLKPYGLKWIEAASRHAVDVLQPDIAWVGGITATVKICHLAEAAGIVVIPHAAMNTPYGQHLCYAMPNVPWGEFFLGSPPGVPLAELTLFPGQPVPQQGTLVPSADAGFGLNVTLEDIERMKA
jgi:L-rhamnonate dehydratase